MITPDLLLDCVLLLIHDRSEANCSAVRAVVAEREEIKVVDPTDLTNLYSRLVGRLLSNGVDCSSPAELNAMLLQFKSDPALEKRRDVYDLLCDAITKRDTMTAEGLAVIKQRVMNAVMLAKSSKLLRSMFGQHMRCSDITDAAALEREIKQIAAKADEFKTLISTNNLGTQTVLPHGLVERINFRDRLTLNRGMEKFTARNVTGVIRSGLQGMNRMFGRAGGIVRSESVLYNALSHHAKSLTLVKWSMWSPLYNTHETKDNRIPLTIMVSLENEAYQNMHTVFRDQYYLKTGQAPTGLTNEQVVTWLHDLFSRQSTALEILRYLPDRFGYEELKGVVEFYENEGYEVVMVIIDYMNCMKKVSSSDASRSGNHLAVKELFNQCCNYTKSRNIALVSAHQLGRDAQRLANSGVKDVVRKFGPEHLADAIDVQREVDVSIFQHKEIRMGDNAPFLTWMKNKHRYDENPPTPEAHKYFAYQFTPHGIIDDIDGAPMYVRNIYGAEAGYADIEEAGELARSSEASFFAMPRRMTEPTIHEQLAATLPTWMAVPDHFAQRVSQLF